MAPPERNPPEPDLPEESGRTEAAIEALQESLAFCERRVERLWAMVNEISDQTFVLDRRLQAVERRIDGLAKHAEQALMESGEGGGEAGGSGGEEPTAPV